MKLTKENCTHKKSVIFNETPNQITFNRESVEVTNSRLVQEKKKNNDSFGQEEKAGQ